MTDMLGALRSLFRPRVRPHTATTAPAADGGREAITIGANVLTVYPATKHEIAYLEKTRAGIDDVDVAIARRLLRPGDRVLDLGANIGFVALHFLALGAKEVHAFEPHPDIYARLSGTGAQGLVCYPYAISAAEGVSELIISRTHNQGSTLHRQVVDIRPQVYGAAPETVTVETRTVDALFPGQSFDYVKVDIEGSELDFVKGAHQLLSARPPRVMVLEVKPEFEADYLAVLRPYFTHVRRADYNRETGGVQFRELGEASDPGYRNVPPNYIFTNDASIF